jgi:hypothetical protein
MRHAVRVETPSLFPPELIEQHESLETIDERPGKSSESVARDFIGWCWSFGSGFHNSPDITNLRFWMQKEKISVSASEEVEVLAEASRLFLKKVAQAVRKADVPQDKD